MAIGTKEWRAELDGHSIRVVNTWFSGAKLYVDGDCLATNAQYLNTDRRRPLLTANLNGRQIEVFLFSVIRTKAKICVDGRRVGGDDF